VIEKQARRQSIAETHQDRDTLFENLEWIGGGYPPYGRRWGELLTARVDDDVRLLGADLEVHSLESDFPQSVEDNVASLGP
jgi:hypothetical protein